MTEDSTSSTRINFTPDVPDLLYRQAGGRCSVPRCTNPTMGPYYRIEGAVNMGVACHIYSAAVNGPRGRGGKSADFISSEENGIWCCAYHANQMDKKKGKDFPASQLFAWKELAEARARKQMNDSPSPLGWVHSIEFTRFIGELKSPKIELTRCTALWSDKNGSGKSSLMQLAASITDAHYGERFLASSGSNEIDGKSEIVFAGKVTYSTVDSFSKIVQLEFSAGELIRREGAAMCLLPPGDVEFIYCEEKALQRRKQEDDLDFLMRVLDLDKSAILAIARLSTGVLMPGTLRFAHSTEDTDEESETEPKKQLKPDGSPYIQLLFKKTSHDFFVSYAGLSGSEQVRLVLDLLISKAREVAKQRLTLLMLDEILGVLDIGNFRHLLEVLAGEPFQSLVALPPAQEKALLNRDDGDIGFIDDDRLAEWRVAVLESPRFPA